MRYLKRFLAVLLLICAVTEAIRYSPLYIYANTAAECKHSFGEWNQFSAATCSSEGKIYRECSLCRKKEYMTVPKSTVITSISPAIKANAGDTVDLSLFSVRSNDGKVTPPKELTWSSESIKIENGCIYAEASGAYLLNVSAKGYSKKVYLLVKQPSDSEYIIYQNDFDSASPELIPIQQTNRAMITQSQGVLILDASSDKNAYIRVILPELVSNFGNYEIHNGNACK